MFSPEPNPLLPRHQLSEVICQLRFPGIDRLRTSLPGEFREAICSRFPGFAANKELRPPKLAGIPGNFHLENSHPGTNYAFTAGNGDYRINLTENFISLSCSRYTGWQDFSNMLDLPLAAFIRIYQPQTFGRIGIRYLNFISRRALSLEETPFRELIAPAYLGPMQQDFIPEQAFSRCTVDCDLLLKNGARVKIHSGPGFVRKGRQKDPEIKFILDFDFYAAGNLPVSSSADVLNKLHSQAYPLFRSAITQELWDAMNN